MCKEAQSANSPGSIAPERLNLLWDNVFKAVFTKDLPASRGALRHLVSTQIGREAVSLTVVANEPTVDSLDERQIRRQLCCRMT
jgi:hypothetical protein